MTSLQIVEKGRLVHTIVAIVLQNVTPTIVGWQDLKAMGSSLLTGLQCRSRRTQFTPLTPTTRRNNWVS
jgi:hypothetical protein